MRVLVVGGTGFIGPHVVKALVGGGHEVAVLHRGNHPDVLPAGVHGIECADTSRAGRAGLLAALPQIRAFAPDVVVDMILMLERDAEIVIDAFAGHARRLVLVSSMDVYRAFGQVLGVESGPPGSLPITEDSPLRERLYPYRGESPRAADDPQHWRDDYDKIPVERVAFSRPELEAAVVRLPRVYGPGDAQRRLFSYVRPMADRRPLLLMDRALARWRWTRAYVENVAHAIALAATHERAAGRTYNVAEAETTSEATWVTSIGRVLGWSGRVVEAEAAALPEHLRFDGDASHDISVDGSRIRRELGYVEPVGWEDGIRRTAEWELANPLRADDALRAEYAAEDAAAALLR